MFLKRFVSVFGLWLALNLFALPAFAGLTPSAPDIGARSWLLMDFNSGHTIAELNADEQVEPASLTKLMTAYIAFRELAQGNIKLSDTTTVSEKAWRMGGSKMFIEVNKQVSMEDLLQGLIVPSGNDAAVAIAEHLAGSEDTCADFMNQTAASLGMTGTHFVNSNGLPDEQHFTTARDMAILTRALIRDFPQYYKWYSQKEYEYGGIKQPNRNRLLWRDKSVDGVKTGHTESAGFCLVTSAQREGVRLISVVMGTESDKARTKASQSVLNYGFRFFETQLLYKANETLNQARVWQGTKKKIALGVTEDLYVTLPRNQRKALKANLNLPKRIMAPVRAGTEIGTVDVMLADKILKSVPLVAMEDIREGGIVDRLMDKARMYVQDF